MDREPQSGAKWTKTFSNVGENEFLTRIMNSKSLKVELTNIVSQKVVSPESVFLKDHDIQEVFKNEITLVFIPEMCFASNVGDDGSAYGPESLTLDLSKFSPSKVYGLGEDSMKLFLHGKEMPANNLIPKKTAFCYVEAKLMPIDDKETIFHIVGYF